MAYVTLLVALLGLTSYSWGQDEPPPSKSAGKVEDKCVRTPERGSCGAAMTRWHFNCASQSCEEFIYGGCGGNENNYETRDDCEVSCYMAYCPPDFSANVQKGKTLQKKKKKKKIDGSGKKKMHESSSEEKGEMEKSEEEDERGNLKRRPKQRRKEGEGDVKEKQKGRKRKDP